VTIHVEDRCQQPHHHHQLYPTPQDKTFKRDTSASSQWQSGASTAQLSPCQNGDVGKMTDAFSKSGGSNDVSPGTIASGASVEELDKPRRPKSMRLNVGRLKKNVVKRRNSLSSSSRHGRSVSSGTGAPDGRVSKSSLYSLSPSAADIDGPLLARSPTNTNTNGELLLRGEATGRNAGSESGYESSGGEMMGAFEGLKWGEYVQFKLPAEGEVRLT